jgi:hypothetical protein
MPTMTRDTPSAVALRKFLERYEKSIPLVDEAMEIITAFAADVARDERARCVKIVETAAGHWRRGKTNCNCYIDLGIIADTIRSETD